MAASGAGPSSAQKASSTARCADPDGASPTAGDHGRSETGRAPGAASELGAGRGRRAAGSSPAREVHPARGGPRRVHRALGGAPGFRRALGGVPGAGGGRGGGRERGGWGGGRGAGPSPGKKPRRSHPGSPSP